MELQAYIQKVESDTIFALEKRLVQSKNRLAFLVDCHTFSAAEIRLNSKTFMWHGRMPAIFEEHKMIVAEKKSQYEDALKVGSACLFSGVLYTENIERRQFLNLP